VTVLAAPTDCQVDPAKNAWIFPRIMKRIVHHDRGDGNRIPSDRTSRRSDELIISAIILLELLAGGCVRVQPNEKGRQLATR
jgi:hypothetical protein